MKVKFQNNQYVSITHVKGVHNKICNALSRSPVGGPEGIKMVLNRLRGQASYACKNIISSVGAISAQGTG